MIPAGYLLKRIVPPPDYLAGIPVRRVCSAAHCVGDDLVDLYEAWSQNIFSLANSPEQLFRLAEAQAVDPFGSTLLYFEVYEREAISGGFIEPKFPDWQPLSECPGNPVQTSPPEAAEFLGFDVVVFGDTLEHSPLSCQEMAREISVNEHCLIDRFEDAKSAIEKGLFYECKEGAYRIFAVHQVGQAFGPSSTHLR